MSKCIECVFAEPRAGMGEYRCTKNGKIFNYQKEDPDACGQFRSSEDNDYSCYECEYYDNGILGKRCKRSGNKVNEYDRACSKFVES